MKTKTQEAGYFKIESFGAVDGPGVRLVVFLQGCPLRCLYCHNPESWAFKKEKTITPQEIVDKFNDSINYYRNGGGITVSGGEPTFYLDFLIELGQLCRKQKIHLTIDSSLAFYNDHNYAKFDQLIELVDLWLIDIKHINPSKHKILCGSDKMLELDFIKKLESLNKPYWVRQVLLPNYTDDPNDLYELGKLLGTLKSMQKFEILPYHNMAVFKYDNLKIKYELKDVQPPTQEKILSSMEAIKKGLSETKNL